MAWKLGFAGAPKFAATVLQRLLASKHHVRVVYTQPDRPAGRGRKPQPCPVRALADARGIEVRTPGHLQAETPTLAALDCLVVAAYGLLLPPAALAAPTLGCINVHASLLPRWRGAAPVERAIMAGDRETGVSIMQMDAGLDTGPVYGTRTLALDGRSTGADATARLAAIGSDALLEVLDALPGLPAQAQDDSAATYAPKLGAGDRIIDWGRDAARIERQVRALGGRLAAYTALPGGIRLQVLEARSATGEGGTPDQAPGTMIRAPRPAIACGSGVLELVTVRLNRGKGKPMDIASAVNGYDAVFAAGTRFGRF